MPAGWNQSIRPGRDSQVLGSRRPIQPCRCDRVETHSRATFYFHSSNNLQHSVHVSSGPVVTSGVDTHRQKYSLWISVTTVNRATSSPVICISQILTPMWAHFQRTESTRVANTTISCETFTADDITFSMEINDRRPNELG